MFFYIKNNYEGGPHLLSTKGIKDFKLTSVAGAYWRGNEKNKMLQRIYGVAFANKEILKTYLNFQLPQRFELDYIGSDGEKHRPIVIHRVIFGSIERFIGILIEHFAGKFPTWLAPVQVKILPISDKFVEYANEVKENLESKGVRVEVDLRAEKIGYKIREARNERVPYMIVVGEKEENDKTISVRSRDNGDEGAVDLNSFIDRIMAEIKNRN